MKNIYTGGCQCGEIRYRIEGEPTDPHFCHCKMCQRMSGAPIVAWVNFPLSSLKYEKGEPKLYKSSNKTHRGFCSTCSSSLFALDDGDDVICMTISTLDNPDLIVPEFDSFISSSPSWMNMNAKKVKKIKK